MKNISEKEIQEILKGNKKFRYQMLSRLQCDCNFYFGNGHRNAKYALWALDEQEHIDLMKRLWNSFKDKEKPKWLTMEQIEEYERMMVFEEV